MTRRPAGKTGGKTGGKSPLDELPLGLTPEPSTDTGDPKNTPKDALGHRQRLRTRFLEGGPEALPDYELLELLLFMAQPRGDVKPLAKELLRQFGGFAEVIAADPAELTRVKGLGEAGVTALKTAQAAALRLLRRGVENRPILGSWDALIDYCHAAMARNRREELRVLFLDRKNRLIADEVQQEGTINRTAIYPREVARRALELHASALILVHNHPSGDPAPSVDDVDMTREVKAAAKSLGIALHDHLIIGREGHVSLSSMGLL